MGKLSRGKLGLGFGIVVAGALPLLFAMASAEAGELKLAHWMSPKHPMHHKMMEPMAADLKSATKGDFTIRIYPGGALGKGANEQFSRAVEGVADITFGLPGYTSDQFKRTLLGELPGVAPDTVAATKQLWKAYDPHLAKDFEPVKLLALWTNDSSILIMREKPVRKLEDLKGLKIRVPSAQAGELVKAWGAVPVSMPAPKIYTSMQTGIIDGVYIGASGITPFKLHEVAKHVTLGLPPAYTTFYLVMNKGVWNGLSDDEKAALERVSGREISIRAAQAYADEGKLGVRVAKQEGLDVVTLAPEEAERFASAAKRAIDVVVADLEKQGIPAKDIVSALAVD